MGIICHTSTKKQVVLAAYSVAGRAAESVVRLIDSASSNVHAAISWNGQCWEVRDLGSMNETWVNGTAVAPKARVALDRGNLLRFGADAEQWELIDDQGPVVVARCLTTGEMKAAENGVLELSDETDDGVSVVLDSDGQWFVVDAEGERHPATNEELISVESHVWKLLVPPASPSVGTYKAKPPISLASATLHFHASPDGQNVSLDIVCGDEKVEFGERAFFTVLLRLARKRQAEELAANQPESERGWYDLPYLAQDVSLDERTVTSALSRFRKLLIRRGIEGGWHIVERRLKQLRIGTTRLQGL